MVRTVFTIVITALLCSAAAYSRPATKTSKGTSKSTSTTKKSPGSSKKGSTPSAKGSQKKGTATARSGAKGKGKRGAVKASPVARGQQAPTPDRIKEIQKALIDRGYMQGEPTGVWGPDSAEALKRFQGSKNLEATGKLSSLSLIHLGLGPKRNVPAPQRTEQQP